MSRDNTCCFTGHRIIGAAFNPERLRRGIDYLIGLGVDTFICGGALGFDTLCAQTVLEAKRDYPHIHLHIYAPCNNQSQRWSCKDRAAYELLLQNADFVDMPSVPYYDGCMRVRNYKMVDASKYCICYMNSPRSGTGQTHSYAKLSGLTIFNLAGKL